MKKGMIKQLVAGLFFTALLTFSLPAQPPPPPPGGGHGGGYDDLPMDAPIGGGLEILLGMGLVYVGLVVRRQFIHRLKEN
jgi:hypothetical protein